MLHPSRYFLGRMWDQQETNRQADLWLLCTVTMCCLVCHDSSRVPWGKEQRGADCETFQSTIQKALPDNNISAHPQLIHYGKYSTI